MTLCLCPRPDGLHRAAAPRLKPVGVNRPPRLALRVVGYRPRAEGDRPGGVRRAVCERHPEGDRLLFYKNGVNPSQLCGFPNG